MTQHINLQGIRENDSQEISFTQLECLHATKSISTFFHLALSTYESTGITNLYSYPSVIQPLLQQYHFLFQER